MPGLRIVASGRDEENDAVLPYRALLVLFLAAALSMTMASTRAETVTLYAAGSLQAPMKDIASSFEQATGEKVVAEFGASGLLKDKIVAGAKVDVFASANMEHPQALAQMKRSGPAVLFAGNKLCALVRPGLAVAPNTLLDQMLDPKVRLATSTPKADPSGDYAFEAFRKAEAWQRGAQATLENKAMQLVGGPNSRLPLPGRSIYGSYIAAGDVDIFLTYCTNAQAAATENPGQQVVGLPDAFSVGADYGLTVMRDAPPAAYRLALFIVSTDGQKMLAKYGFAAPGLPR